MQLCGKVKILKFTVTWKELEGVLFRGANQKLKAKN